MSEGRTYLHKPNDDDQRYQHALGDIEDLPAQLLLPRAEHALLALRPARAEVAYDDVHEERANGEVEQEV